MPLLLAYQMLPRALHIYKQKTLTASSALCVSPLKQSATPADNRLVSPSAATITFLRTGVVDYRAFSDRDVVFFYIDGQWKHNILVGPW
jgi:hypothetical protein